MSAPQGPIAVLGAGTLGRDIGNHYAAARDGLPDSPRQLLGEYVAQGRLGSKSGRGFYDYGAE